MSEMIVTPDQEAILSEIHIAAQPERVFQALVDPEQVPQWWGQYGVYRCTRFEADLRVGGRWRCSGVGPDGGDFEVKGEYLEIDPPCLLVHSWIASWTGEVKTTVRWQVVSADQGTIVRIQHCGLASHPEVAQAYRGWPRMLTWLQAFLEKGETVEMRKAS